MGRNNRSRKRTDAMNRIKKVRYAAKDLQRLKKTLGLLDAEGNEIMKDIEEVAVVKTSKQIKREKKDKERATFIAEFEEKSDKGEEVKVVNENSGKEHTYNTKTMKDEHGSYPPWYKAKKTLKKCRKLDHARKQRFRQQWTTVNVPL